MVADLVVIVGIFGGLCRKLLSLFAQHELGVVVVLLFGEKLVVMFAAALVDLVGSGFETFPKFLLLVVRNGSDFLPLVVEVLKGGESLVDGFHQHQSFGLFAQFYLLLKVLLEIQIFEFLVNTENIEEFLHKEMIVLPEVVRLVLRHGTDGFPLFLKVFELVVQHLEVGLVFHEHAQFFNDAAFGLQVLLFFLFKILQEFLLVVLESVQGLIEFQLDVGDFGFEILFLVVFVSEEGLFLGLTVLFEDSQDVGFQHAHAGFDFVVVGFGDHAADFLNGLVQREVFILCLNLFEGFHRFFRSGFGLYGFRGGLVVFDFAHHFGGGFGSWFCSGFLRSGGFNGLLRFLGGYRFFRNLRLRLFSRGGFGDRFRSFRGGLHSGSGGFFRGGFFYGLRLCLFFGGRFGGSLRNFFRYSFLCYFGCTGSRIKILIFIIFRAEKVFFFHKIKRILNE